MKSIQLHQKPRSKLSLSDHYETPKDVFEKLCRRYRIYPKLDVCATKKNTKCKKYFSIRDNGLKKKWNYDVWCNPPHTLTGEFIKKASEEWRRTGCKISILMIVPANTMSTQYWHKYIKIGPTYHPIEGRISFRYNGKASEFSSRNAYVSIKWHKMK